MGESQPAATARWARTWRFYVVLTGSGLVVIAGLFVILTTVAVSSGIRAVLSRLGFVGLVVVTITSGRAALGLGAQLIRDR